MSTVIYLAIIALLAVMYIHLRSQKNRLNRLYEDLHLQVATKDQLTGLYHRHFFDEYYKAESQRVLGFVQNIPQEEERHFFSVTLFNIENFKDINLAYGHEMGDRALKQVATILTDLVFSRDLLCRYDGAEFAVLFTNSNNHDLVLQKSKLIKDSIEELAINTDGEQPLKLHINTGSAFFDTDYIMGDSFSVLRAAEKRLRQAKRDLIDGES